MKRISLLLMMLVVCMTVYGQSKLTAQAQLKVKRIKAETASAEKRKKNNVRDGRQNEPVTALFVVMIGEKCNAAATIRQMRDAGAVVKSKLGHQMVVSIPIDSIGALERIDGVERIDNGHKGRKKTDVTRVETGVSRLNGTGEDVMSPAYSGKGVTVCLIDGGFDFQHPAFQDEAGNSRIKCVYMMNDEGGNPFTVNDPDAGELTFPGSVYDTPELIGQLTTDDEENIHGTHTAGIAAGSFSPQGFAGMAPEADIVLIPVSVGYVDDDDVSTEDFVELALSFAEAYAKKSGQPMVLSASINSHVGPHDGTSTVNKAIEELSKTVIPVFSAGNEGEDPIHIYHRFTEEEPSFKCALLGSSEDEMENTYTYYFQTNGYAISGEELAIQLEIWHVDYEQADIDIVWKSRECKAKIGGEPELLEVSDETDPTFPEQLSGNLQFGITDNGNGKLFMFVKGCAESTDIYWFILNVSGAGGTEFHAWNDPSGFGGTQYGEDFKEADSDFSGGDWTCTDRVISVGAYCANVLRRNYDGSISDITDLSDDDDDDDAYDDDDDEYEFAKYRQDTDNDDDEEESDESETVLNGIATFSSYGTFFNGVSQPTICAPGVNVVSAYSHYGVDEDDEVAESMSWNGYPYNAEDGTSMSCPVVSGIVALWLQANPDLTFDNVMEVLSETSRNDEYTEILPERWGFGKIDAKKGLEFILDSTGIEMISETDATTKLSYAKGWYTIDGRRLTAKPAVRGLYIHNGKKVAL